MIDGDKIEALNSAYTIVMQSVTCSECGSIKVCAYFDQQVGRMVAQCLQCGHQWTMMRFKLDEITRGDMNRLTSWANIVKNADDRRCHICGSTIGVEAHHIIPKDHDPMKKYWFDRRNGVALCQRCHELVHGTWMSKYRRDRRKGG